VKVHSHRVIRLLCCFLAVLSIVWLSSACQPSSPSPVPTPSEVAAVLSATPPPMPTAVPTAAPTTVATQPAVAPTDTLPPSTAVEVPSDMPSPAATAGAGETATAVPIPSSTPLLMPTAAATVKPGAKASATPTRAPSASPTAAPTAGEHWEVRTLLAGPGQPGRLYALLTEMSMAAWPAERVRFLISDDYGQSWSPFPGGLPAEECVVNVNLDYATPDALYASTCQGLYRWSGGEWILVSSQETGMVAVVYGRPQVIWATRAFSQGAAVIRSEDGGATWSPAGDGLSSFNGIANVGIDPRDANTLYAIIWPKYGGSYLRRGTANGQWQTMPTPLNNLQIDTGMTIDGATGALYVTVYASGWQLWRTLNPGAPDLTDLRWELVYDFGADIAWATLLASGWSPEGLALYANLSPWLDKASGLTGGPALHRSLDGGQSWEALALGLP
jgi:hypothetical protein